jgi:hypothetical protein
VSSDTEFPDQEQGDGQVGYGRPPKTTRFKKGQSGNPKGRPKGSLNVATVLIKTLSEKVVINENGQRKTVTKFEAALKQLVNKALGSDIRALRLLLDLARDAEAKQGVAGGEQNPVLGELDQEVIAGIRKRFQESDQQSQETQEVDNGENQRG